MPAYRGFRNRTERNIDLCAAALVSCAGLFVMFKGHLIGFLLVLAGFCLVMACMIRPVAPRGWDSIDTSHD